MSSFEPAIFLHSLFLFSFIFPKLLLNWWNPKFAKKWAGSLRIWYNSQLCRTIFTKFRILFNNHNNTFSLAPAVANFVWESSDIGSVEMSLSSYVGVSALSRTLSTSRCFLNIHDIDFMEDVQIFGLFNIFSMKFFSSFSHQLTPLGYFSHPTFFVLFFIV